MKPVICGHLGAPDQQGRSVFSKGQEHLKLKETGEIGWSLWETTGHTMEGSEQSSLEFDLEEVNLSQE